MSAVSTIEEQQSIEESLLSFLRDDAPEVYALWKSTRGNEEGNTLSLNRRKHFKFLVKNLNPDAWASESTYANQPWLVYWALQAGELLGITEKLFERVSSRELVDFLLLHLKEEEDTMSGTRSPNQHRFCCFAGAPLGKGPHMLSTYAACCALAILDSEKLKTLPRESMKRWLLSLRNEDGSFRVNSIGETDIRASYSAAVITTLLCLDDSATFPQKSDVARTPVLNARVADYVLSCQTQEGGFSCVKHSSEAHGSYTFCAVAALFIMHQLHRCYLPSLRRWLVARQCVFEGGFCGRTNKLVDSCYSFWVGASHAILAGEESLRNFLRLSQVQSRHTLQRLCMTAKELSLLHYLQIIDIHTVSATDHKLCDKQEKDVRLEDDDIDQFLSTEDASVGTSTLAFSKNKIFLDLVDGDNGKKENSPSVISDEEVGDFYFNQRRLQTYVLQACQDKSGGLRDKPCLSADTYHTCYALGGLSIAQNTHNLNICNVRTPYLEHAFSHGYLPGKKAHKDSSNAGYGIVLPGDAQSAAAHNALTRSINPIFNLNRSRIQDAWKLWGLRINL